MPASRDDLLAEYLDFGAIDQVGYGQFGKFYEIYESSGAVQEDPDDDVEMFTQFLNAFVPDEEAHTREWWLDIRESFYNLAEITDEDIDWEAYREAIGYGTS